MSRTARFALALSAITLASAAIATPAFAHADGPDYYRVVNVQGSSVLNLRARPGTYAHTVDEIPFNARRLTNLTQTRGRWTRIKYNGRIGWVHNDYLAEDSQSGPTIYKVVGVKAWDSLSIRKKPQVSARLIGEIPGSADNVEDCGACQSVWCPVRYNKVEGWVHKRFLAVVGYPRGKRFSENDRPFNNRSADGTPSHDKSFNDKSFNDTSSNDRRRNFRNLYSNEFMGLGTSRRLTWRERLRNRWLGQKHRSDNNWKHD